MSSRSSSSTSSRPSSSSSSTRSPRSSASTRSSHSSASTRSSHSSASSHYSHSSTSSSSPSSSKRTTPNRTASMRQAPSAPGVQTFLSDPENEILCKPIPEPYLIAPLTIGPLDTPSIAENNQAYERYYFFREINEAAKNNRRPFYQDGGYGWLVIYFNKEWAAFLKQLDSEREESRSDLFRLGGHEEVKVVREGVEEDAGEMIPETDLNAPVQGILKEMYGMYVVEAEVKRRLEVREELRKTQLKDNALSLRKKSSSAGSEKSVDDSRHRRQKSVHRHLDVSRRAELDEERVYAQLVEQLTSFADMTALEIAPAHTSRYSMEYGRGSLKPVQRPSVQRNRSSRYSEDLKNVAFENAPGNSPSASMKSVRNEPKNEAEDEEKSLKKPKRVSTWLKKVVS